MSNITPLVDKEERSAELSRALMATFLKNVPDYIYFKDRESRFTGMSASFVQRVGRSSAAEIFGKTDFDLFDRSHAQAAFETEQGILTTGQPISNLLEKETWADGRVTWVMTTKLPLRDSTGAIIGTFGLSRDVTKQQEMEAKIASTNKELVTTSRVAGMAEVATGVLHNVGNVLNSLNVSASVIATGFRQSKTESLAKLTQLIREQGPNLGTFLTSDPKGRRIPEFIQSLAQHFSEERKRLLQELDSLQKNVDHIKEIVSMQQSYATMAGVTEPLDPLGLMEDAINMNSTALIRHEVRMVRQFETVPRVQAEKGKVLQILVNLIRNAKYACDESGKVEKIMTLQIRPGEAGRVQFVVEDNGIGIPPENLTQIFRHGFTTKATGHGFGVNSSSIAAKEMNGSLTAHSSGLGQGARFTLDLPVAIVTTPPLPP